MLGGILLGVRPVLDPMSDKRASCMCCLGSQTLNTYYDDDDDRSDLGAFSHIIGVRHHKINTRNS